MSYKILYTCGREPSYMRNAVILQSLQSFADMDLIVDTSPSYSNRLSRIIIRILTKKNYDYDLVVCGFLGHPLIPFIRSRYHGPILFDAFISLYDTLCLDRKRFKPGSWAANLIKKIDQISCDQSEMVMLDTQAHANFFGDTFNLPTRKLASLFVGCDEAVFFPRHENDKSQTILYYGSYLPLQGIDVIIKAAKLVSDIPSIKFKIIGQGLVSTEINSLVREIQPDNIEFAPPVSLEQLAQEIARADICLCGHFSAIPKAARVIAGKTFQCIAMGKPVIVGNNPANLELLTPDKDALFVDMNNPHALANAIRILASDPDLRQSLGEMARNTYLTHASQKVISEQFKEIVESTINKQY